MAFHHTGDLGDIVFALPSIRHLGGGTLYISPSDNTREPMTQARMDFLRPLLMAQPYIKAVEWRKGETVKHDFAPFRQGWVRHVALAELQRRCVSPMKRIAFDTPWLTVDEKPHGRPVFARSFRYRNAAWEPIWKELVTKYPKALFVGTKEEHIDFTLRFGSVAHQPTPNALVMAELIRGSLFFAGNQSCPNAIAEGLKHQSILEVNTASRDCHYPRENALHVATGGDYNPNLVKPRIALALQFHPACLEAVDELIELLCDNEATPRNDVEFWLFARDDVNHEALERFERVLRAKFPVRVIQSTRRGRGWPEGCNDLWQSCMIQANRLVRTARTNVEAVFTFESDVVPIRANWIDRLIDEWQTTKNSGKTACGLIAGDSEDRIHLNGNAIFATTITHQFQQLQSSFGPWDDTHKELLRRIGRGSDFIINRYQLPTITPGEIQLMRKTNAVLLHGVKDGSARAAVREMIGNNIFD